MSGKFLRVKVCHPESFDFLGLCCLDSLIESDLLIEFRVGHWIRVVVAIVVVVEILLLLLDKGGAKFNPSTSIIFTRLYSHVSKA